MFWFILAAAFVIIWGGLNAAKDYKRINENGYSAMVNIVTVGAAAVFFIYLIPIYNWASSF